MEDRRSQAPERADVERRLRGFELAQRLSRVGHWRWTLASDELSWSDEVFRIHGHAPGAFRPDVRRAVAFYHPGDQAVVDGHLQRAIDERRDFEFQLRVVRPDGSIRDVLASGFCELDDTGAVQALFGTFQDVTELRQAEREHAVVRRRLQLAVDSAGLGVWDLDLVGQRLSWDPRMLEMYGLDPRQRTGAVDDWIGALHPEDRPQAVESFEAAIAGEAEFDVRFRIVRRADGAVRHMQANAVVERDADGQPLRMVGINQDVTERVQAEARFRAALDHLAVATFICRPDGIVEFANGAAGALFGSEPDHLEGRDLGGLLGADALGTGADPRPEQLAFDRRARRLDGGSFPAHVGTGELDGPDGRRLVVSVQDLSTLRDLQQQLGHAQRMEAVGQLAGGIAHDFNNLLGVLAGHADLMEDGLGDDPELQDSLEAIRHAVERGASLTKRLLAYSRKQTLSPTVVDVAVVVRELGELLRRTLGETVELRLEPPTGPTRVRVDRHQLEDVLLNLALNAGHAMPEGGRLTISVAGGTAAPGAVDGAGAGSPFVRLTVRDSGVGMAPEVQERVFEPFFTTRDVGEGRGLGLSMVYGFVHQSGGHVTLESDLGVGTAVFLYLPQVTEAPEATPEAEAAAPAEAEESVILLVEDDPDVRGVARRLLERAGYRVLEASDASAALEWLWSEARLDLLFTDVTLPRGISGPEIAREAATLRPELPVLFTTGYALDGRRPDAVPPDDAPVLRKPFRRDELLTAVAERFETAAAGSPRS